MTLSTELAASLANAVYGIRESSNVERGVVDRGEAALLRGGLFDFSKATVLTGSSGIGMRATSGFSMVIPCKGVMQGEYVVATRGTVTAADWMSDFAAALEPGPEGCAVHAGFNRVANSVLPGVTTALRNKNPRKFHVVGHSLGGAVSNIVATSLKGEGIGIELYTFGAPRAGLTPFRELLSARVGEPNIYRAFSMSDPVPLVPIFPFLHAPSMQPGALCGSRHGLVVPWAHFMNAYKTAVENQSWSNLRTAAQTTPLNIEELLNLAAVKIRIPFVSGGIQLLSRILGKLLGASNVAMGSAVTGGVTVIDQMAMTLSQGRASSPEIDSQLSRFVKHTMAFVGSPFSMGTTLTVAYLSHVLGLLLRPIVGRATIAIHRPDQDA